MRPLLQPLAVLILAALLWSLVPGGAPASRYDVVVYGGTAGGVITAISAAREGATVALLEPGHHLGGMVTGGLSRTDHGNKDAVGGYSREFYRRLGKHYGQEIAWYPEPHVAEEVLDDWLKEAGVKIFLDHRLKEKDGVRMQGNRLTALETENGAVLGAKVFVDASYEGDMMAQAGVAYTVGRESAKQYGESLAGVRPKDRNHQFDYPVPAYDAKGTLLPEIQEGPRGDIGAGDRKVQAYNFRLILSKDPANRRPYPRPAGYDPGRFEVLAQYLRVFEEHEARPPRLDEILLPWAIPNQKADFNNRGPFSTDFIGHSWDYPEASYERRDEIRRQHASYTQGLFYFLANDERVPKPLRDEVNQWGLARDEFTDNDNWPYQLYVREARRMVGDFVMTQKDIQTELTKHDVIGMGSYNSDSHNVQRFALPDGTVQNEGNMEVPVSPYQIPYRVLLPKKEQAENLLVPVCFSASHVTYSTLRMEPVYMIMGQAAGVAAKMAIDKGVAVQEIDTQALTKRLREQGAVMELAAE